MENVISHFEQNSEKEEKYYSKTNFNVFTYKEPEISMQFQIKEELFKIAPKIKNDEYFWFGKFGRGGFGSVNKGYNKTLGKFIAVKSFNGNSPKVLNQIYLEDYLMNEKFGNFAGKLHSEQRYQT